MTDGLTSPARLRASVLSRGALDLRERVEGGPAARLAFLGGLAISLSVFSGNFTKIVPHVPVDRVVMLVFVLAALRATWRDHFTIRPIHVVLVAQFLWVLGSAVGTANLTHSSGFYALADQIVVPSILFTLAPVAFGSIRQRVVLVRVIAVACIYVGFTSIFQALGYRALVFPGYIKAVAIPGEINRAVGPSLQVGSNGAMLVMCIAPLLWLLMRSKGVWRVVIAIALVATVAGAFLTLTRSVWIGGFLSFVLFALFTPAIRRFAIACVIGAVLIFFVVIAVSPSLSDLITARVNTVRSLDDRSTTNLAALHMFNDHPLFGIGWGTFLDHVDNYVRQQDTVPLTFTHIPAHNVMLSRLAELGFVGGFLFAVSLVLGPVLSYFRGRKSGQDGWEVILLGSFVAWFVVAMLTPMGYAFPNYFLWLLAGICYVPLRKSDVLRRAVVGRRAAQTPEVAT